MVEGGRGLNQRRGDGVLTQSAEAPEARGDGSFNAGEARRGDAEGGETRGAARGAEHPGVAVQLGA